MKLRLIVGLAWLVCISAQAQQSNEAYYQEQRAIQAQQHAAEMNRFGMEQAQHGQQAQQYNVVQPPPPRYYGALVTDGAQIFLASYHPDGNAAAAAALMACERDLGVGKCEPLGWFSEQCASVARGPDRRLYVGHSPYETMSSRDAMHRCNAASPSGTCRLKTLPLCVGSRYGAHSNERSLAASAQQLEIWTTMASTP